MFDSIFTLAVDAAQDASFVQRIKDTINALSVPEISLSFFFVPLFILMFAGYKVWTRPVAAIMVLLAFLALYFGSMADPNYRSIVAKADNVPITLMLLGVGFCMWWALRQAAINDTRMKRGQPLIEEGKDDKVLCWPDLVYTEMIVIILATAVLVLWAILLPAPLESPANPAGPPNPSKAPWYFLGLQEMLVYFDPWMAGVVLPGLIVTGLIAMPYIDVNPKGNGYYTLAQRPFAISVWMFGFIILWVVLIVFGTFLRGPNWNFFGPYEVWDSHLQVPLTNINLSDMFWLDLMSQPLPTTATHGGLAPLIRELPGLVFVVFWMVGLPIILTLTVFRRMRQTLGFARYLVMVIHFVVMALLPLKMVLRWLFVLKYFIYLPEFNLNL